MGCYRLPPSLRKHSSSSNKLSWIRIHCFPRGHLSWPRDKRQRVVHILDVHSVHCLHWLSILIRWVSSYQLHRWIQNEQNHRSTCGVLNRSYTFLDFHKQLWMGFLWPLRPLHHELRGPWSCFDVMRFSWMDIWERINSHPVSCAQEITQIPGCCLLVPSHHSLVLLPLWLPWLLWDWNHSAFPNLLPLSFHLLLCCEKWIPIDFLVPRDYALRCWQNFNEHHLAFSHPLRLFSRRWEKAMDVVLWRVLWNHDQVLKPSCPCVHAVLESCSWP